MLIARVVLQIGVGHEGNDRVENRRRLEPAEAARIERRNRLQAENDETEHEQPDREDEHRQHVLLPVLRSGVDQLLEPTQKPWPVIFAVHQPSEIGAERNRQNDRRDEEQSRKQPHGSSLSDYARPALLRVARGVRQKLREPRFVRTTLAAQAQ